ncbi:MAG: cell division transport system permease protein [Rhodospirillaceae bacterium]|jgi:cell division transport system permease protein|nr:cell division transport system permease protein [Rhodospirillaceae bacterium]
MLRSDLPPDRDAGVFLPAIIGFMVFLAGIALTGSLALENLLRHWQGSIEASVTAQLPPVEGESAAAARSRREGALALFAQMPGIESAALLSETEKARLLSPWLGADIAGLDLPLPDLIAVVTAPGAKLDLAALTAKLQAVSPGASLDDHAGLRNGIAGIARAATLAMLGLLLLIGAAAAATVFFVARAGFAAHRRVIDILHLIGAHDGYIAGQFQRNALVRGLAGGAVGAFVAAAIFEAARRWLPGIEAQEVALTPTQWGMLALLPLGAALLAMATARYTVLRALRRVL